MIWSEKDIRLTEPSADKRKIFLRRKELLGLRALKVNAIARFQRQIEQIDRELLALEQEEKANTSAR